jgi:hypothetical protein
VLLDRGLGWKHYFINDILAIEQTKGSTKDKIRSGFVVLYL